jgi:hypothetical protein
MEVETTTWSERLQQLHDAWERHAAGRSVAGAFARRPQTFRFVSEIPPNVDDLVALDVRASDLPRLVELQTIKALALIGAASTEVIECVGHLGGLRSLSLSVAKGANLTPVGRLQGLEHLSLDGASIASLAPLAALHQLKTLAINDLGKLANIQELRALRQLRWLLISGGMWTKYRLPTLRPLASLTQLECFVLISTHVQDGSLEPLAGLSRLHHVGLPNYFAIAEFARLAAALPTTVGAFRSPWFMEPRSADEVNYAACKTCHRYTRGMTIGSPTKRLCPHCHADRIAKHIAGWEALVSAARDRVRNSNAAT